MSFLSRCAVTFALNYLANSMRVNTKVGSNETQDVGADTKDCPRFPPIAGASDQCREAMYGTLVVGCVSAEGLHKGSFFDKSDPYCRVRLSDKSATESRGFLKKYKKFIARSASGQTGYKNNDLSPTWNEAFTFELVCPTSMAHLWQLEVAIKDKDIDADDDLGFAYVPLEQVVAGQMNGEKTLQIVTNKADSKDKRGKGKGKVKLFVQYCAPGDHSCKQGAVHSAGAAIESRSNIRVECGQSCYAHMKKVISVVDSARSKVQEAIQQDNLADHFDGLGDHYDDVGDHADDTGNHEAEAHAQHLEDRYDHLEDRAEANTKHAWKVAVADMGSLKRDLERTASTTCPGSAFVQSVVDAASPAFVSVKKKFKGSHAKAVSGRLNQAGAALKSLGHCLEQRWWAGETLPNIHSVSDHCQAYFAR